MPFDIKGIGMAFVYYGFIYVYLNDYMWKIPFDIRSIGKVFLLYE